MKNCQEEHVSEWQVSVHKTYRGREEELNGFYIIMANRPLLVQESEGINRV